MSLRLLIIPVALLLLQGCDFSRPDLKSPCVGIDDSPCGPKRSVNEWWLNKQAKGQG